MILTNGKGVPFERPDPPPAEASLEVRLEFMRALRAYHDVVAACANAAFDSAFRDSIREGTR